VIIFFLVEICLLGLKTPIPHWTFVLGFPVVLVTVLTWGTVIGLLSARFRDMRFMLPYIGQLMFYITPIIWRVGDISTKRAYVAYLNPLYGLLEIIRAPLLGYPANAHAWSLALGSMVSGIIAWMLIFIPFRKRIPFWV